LDKTIDESVDFPEEHELPRGGIVGVVEIVDCVTKSSSPWFHKGGYGFVLKNARPLPFVKRSGWLRFFKV